MVKASSIKNSYLGWCLKHALPPRRLSADRYWAAIELLLAVQAPMSSASCLRSVMKTRTTWYDGRRRPSSSRFYGF